MTKFRVITEDRKEIMTSENYKGCENYWNSCNGIYIDEDGEHRIFIEEFCTTYEQDLKELNITAEEFDNVISYIYDKTDAEMITISKTIKSSADVLPVVRRALERVLGMRQTERQEAYKFHYGL